MIRLQTPLSSFRTWRTNPTTTANNTGDHFVIPQDRDCPLGRPNLDKQTNKRRWSVVCRAAGAGVPPLLPRLGPTFAREGRGVYISYPVSAGRTVCGVVSLCSFLSVDYVTGQEPHAWRDRADLWLCDVSVDKVTLMLGSAATSLG